MGHLICRPQTVIAVALASWMLLTSVPAAPHIPSREEREAIDVCLGRMPAGIQVAVALVRRGEVRFLGAEQTGAGIRPVENRGAVFQIASITKVFTAALLAREVVQGNLSLDDPVAARIGVPLKAVGRDGVAMTLGHLASHTSGIAHHQPPWLGVRSWLRLHPREPWKGYDRERFERYLARELTVQSTPGTAYHYSNMGMSLLGLALSERAGKPYETLLQEGIFGPLGMQYSTTDFNRVRDRVVVGRKVDGTTYPNQDMEALTPSGGIFTSAEDMARFAAAVLGGTDPALALTQRPVFTIADREQVALGWHVYTWREGWQILNHNGGIGGYTTTLNVDPENGRAVVVLANVMNVGEHGEAVRALGRALLRIIAASAPDEPVSLAGVRRQRLEVTSTPRPGKGSLPTR